MIPCDLESSRASDVPVFILSSVAVDPPNPVGSTGVETDCFSDNHNFGSYDAYQLLGEKYKSAPFYLQNVSFLI